MSTSDEALSALIKIRADFAAFCDLHGNVTEADTRSKIIDRILKDVCAWPENAIQREEHSHSGFADYVLTVNSRRLAVVEAKREGIPFVIPYETRKTRHSLSGALISQAPVREAIDQVRSYCDDNVARYAIATNGYAWIIFRALREDMNWRNGSAIVFPSLDYIAAHFTDFWNLLSYSAVAGGSLDREFSAFQGASRNLYRVIDRLFNADLPLQRNRLHAQLEPVIRAIFDDIADQQAIEILESCYVHTASLLIVAADLNCVITDSLPQFLSHEGARDLKQGATHSGRFGEDLSAAMNRERGELFLLLGGIGSGKTTFLKRYQRTVGKDLLNRDAIWFHIDFLRAPLDPLDLEKFVWSEVLEQLRDRHSSANLERTKNIKRVFASDIAVLRETVLRQHREGTNEYEGTLGKYLEDWRHDLARYVPGLLRTFKQRHGAVVLFIDNVDQLSPAYQAQVFLLAQRVTRTVGSITVVSLREESYYAASIQKTFTAYSNRKFHIASPRFRVLIGNRIRFAITALKRSEEGLQLILPSGFQFDKSAIVDFLQIVQESVFQQNRNIARFIEAICFGNMRLALQMFTTFLTSGVTDVEKMLYLYRREGSYYVAFHEFVKSIMLGDRKYYKEEQSPILNVFDCGSESNASHLTSLRIMEALMEHRRENTPEGQGYVEIAPLLAGFEEFFDNRADFVRSMERMIRRQLVELNSRSTDTIQGASHVRITSAGWFYARFLSRSFPYLDLALQDTPLDDADVERDLTRAVHGVDNLSDREDQKLERMEVRFHRVECFLGYLERQEAEEGGRFGLSARSGPLAQKFVPRIKSEYERQRDYIRQRLRQNRERFAEDFPVISAEDEESAELDGLTVEDSEPVALDENCGEGPPGEPSRT